MTTSDIEANLSADALRFLMDPAFREEPEAFYERMLATGPVHEIGGGMWFVVGHAEVDAALRDNRFSRARGAVEELAFLTEAEDEDVRYSGQCLRNAMLMVDPPEHTRLRKLHRAPFLPRAVSRWQPFIAELARDLVQAFPTDETFDLKRAYCFPIPERAICQILGVPYEDHAKFERWTDALLRVDRSGNATAESLRPARGAILEFQQYLTRVVAGRRQTPGDDLLSELLSAEEDGDQLTDAELVGNLILLVSAGHETTANTIASSVVLLMTNRDQWEMLVDDPTLVPNAVEEVLRLEGAQRFNVPRIAAEDIELGGKVIPAGSRVAFITHAANRDPEVFQEPLRFDITRDPNPHVGFGMGAHLCLGMHLARLELTIALETLVREVPSLDLAVGRDELRGTDGPTIRGWQTVPVRIPAG